MLGRHRRQVDELDAHVEMREHPRLGELGGEGVRAHGGVGSRQPPVERRLARVGRPEQCHLAGPLGMDDVGRTGVGPTLAGTGQLLAELLDAAADVGLEMLSALVFGQGAQHLPERGEPVFRGAGLTKLRFGLLVLG